jgi:hypothetical protein
MVVPGVLCDEANLVFRRSVRGNETAEIGAEVRESRGVNDELGDTNGVGL